MPLRTQLAANRASCELDGTFCSQIARIGQTADQRDSSAWSTGEPYREGVSGKALVGLVIAAALGGGCGQSATVHSTSSPGPAAQPEPVSKSGSGPMLLGRSEEGRPIVALRVGDPSGPRVLVFGCIHGDERAGIAVAHALERIHTVNDVWIVPNLNPDGSALGTRQDGRGVDLNANWSSQWQAGGSPWDVYYAGPRPFSERETRIAHALIVRIRPRVTIWYHQHMDVVWAFGASTAAGRIYARVAGMRLYHHHCLPGTATNWQNHHLPATAAFTVELPAGNLSQQQVQQHVSAVLSVAALARTRRGLGRT